MKKTLFKLKASENDINERESGTYESKGMKKQQLGKLTEIIVQLQPKWERYGALTVSIDYSLHCPYGLCSHYQKWLFKHYNWALCKPYF